MAIKATINSIPRDRISIDKQENILVRSVVTGGQLTLSLSSLIDVDRTNSQNNYVLVYNASTNKYVAQILPVIDGGIF